MAVALVSLLTNCRELALTFSASVNDTIIADTGLTQSSSYTYEVSLRRGGETPSRSNQVAVHTLSPSSDAFAWQTFLIGESGSYLSDVAIINDTMASAVGELYKRDSLGNLDYTPYGMAVWNDHNCSLRRIMVTSQQGDLFSCIFYGVHAFSASDVWLANGIPIRWVNMSILVTPFWINSYPGNPNPVLGPNQALYRFWGTSNANLWGVGANGAIARFDGTRWQRVESGTTTNIEDVGGAINPATGNEEVYCAVTSFFTTGDRKILKITNHNSVVSLQWDPQRAVSSVWTNKGYPLYACGDGWFVTEGSSWRHTSLGLHGYMNAVRGNGLNDIFVSDVFGNLAHFNGYGWQVVHGLSSGGPSALAVKGNLVIAVGSDGQGHGLVTVGRRN